MLAHGITQCGYNHLRKLHILVIDPFLLCVDISDSVGRLKPPECIRGHTSSTSPVQKVSQNGIIVLCADHLVKEGMDAYPFFLLSSAILSRTERLTSVFRALSIAEAIALLVSTLFRGLPK